MRTIWIHENMQLGCFIVVLSICGVCVWFICTVTWGSIAWVDGCVCSVLYNSFVIEPDSMIFFFSIMQTSQRKKNWRNYHPAHDIVSVTYLLPHQITFGRWDSLPLRPAGREVKNLWSSILKSDSEGNLYDSFRCWWEVNQRIGFFGSQIALNLLSFATSYFLALPGKYKCFVRSFCIQCSLYEKLLFYNLLYLLDFMHLFYYKCRHSYFCIIFYPNFSFLLNTKWMNKTSLVCGSLIG